MYNARHVLLLSLVTVLAARGLRADALDPWRGWVAFKEFARGIAEEPDPGVSVQVSTDEDGRAHLILLRQAFDAGGSGRYPAGGVVCEFVFPACRTRIADVEWWTFDHGTFARFVDRVEQDIVIADVLVRDVEKSSVYWEEA